MPLPTDNDGMRSAPIVKLSGKGWRLLGRLSKKQFESPV